jgi:hypothetical protein
MGADWTDRRGDDQADDPIGGDRQYGMRVGKQYGMRPMRQYGMRPLGRQYGMRPLGRQYGMRPIRQYGMRPIRQYGMRPVEAEDDAGYLDPAEWSAEIAERFCAMSATVRLGARVVCDIDDLLIPARQVRAVYLEPPEAMTNASDLAAAESDGDPPDAAARAAAVRNARIPAGQRTLRPREHELSVQLGVRNSLVQAIAKHPEVADALKSDIARALAVRADSAFLHGGGGRYAPVGITAFSDPAGSMATSPFALARDILEQFRTGPQPRRFENPGWILDPATLDTLTRMPTDRNTEGDTKTLDATRLLELDGADGGLLLGYPFVVTRAATEKDGGRLYFSSDWSEAWIGAGSDLVSVEFSSEADFAKDSTIVKAVMHHDFVVRRPSLFTYTDPIVPDAASADALAARGKAVAAQTAAEAAEKAAEEAAGVADDAKAKAEVASEAVEALAAKAEAARAKAKAAAADKHNRS